jgi:hypothetical protein
MDELVRFDDTMVELREAFGAVHYKGLPPSRHRSRRRAWVGTAVAISVIAVVWTAVGGGERIAWAAEARRPSAEEQASIDQNCQETIAEEEGSRLQTLPPLMTSEVRGDLISSTHAGGEWFVTCVESVDGGRFVRAVFWSHVSELFQGKGAVRFTDMALFPTDGEPGSRFVTGTVAPDIARLTVETAGLPEFDATVANGWFTAWWQSGYPFVLRAYEEDGALVTEVNGP